MLKCLYIRELIEKFAKRESAAAFEIYDGIQVKKISYGELAEDVLKCAGYFKANGIVKQHIALAAPNSYEWAVTYFAILASGNIAVLMNPSLPGDELASMCERSDTSYVWCDPATKNLLEGNQAEVTYLSFEELIESEMMSLQEIPEREQQEIVCLLFTSGTSGLSKVVMISMENLESSTESLEERFAQPNQERPLLVLPLYHVGGMRSLVGTMLYGNIMCLGRGMKYIFTDAPVLNPTALTLVPVIAESMIKIFKRLPDKKAYAKYIGNNVQYISVVGALFRKDSLRYLMSLGFSMGTSYGMTETTGCAVYCAYNEENVNSIGKLEGKTQCKIVDGEILLKGPTVMAGYYKNPEETEAVLIDGWMHTGDMGYCDENGYYYISGRKKNIIILASGENVNPEEIEAKFAYCDHILESMVYSDGKGICADVYTNNEENAAEFIKNYNESVPLYRQVYKVFYSEQPLEKTGSGKIKRKENKYE